MMNPCRGLLRIRRASDLALTALFGLALDFDLIGGDLRAASVVLGAVVRRYCRPSQTFARDAGSPFCEENYGPLLRQQINFQYLLDCVRVRFDHSRPSHWSRGREDCDDAMGLVASQLADILYAMLLSTLTSTSSPSVARGERDVGALVATLTECPLGSVCAHIVTIVITKLLIKCDVLSPACLGVSNLKEHRKRRGSSKRDPDDIALESRLGRNMLLCHYHDVVAPLILGRTAPTSGGLGIKEVRDGDVHAPAPSRDAASDLPLDWTCHWRLTLLTFSWLSSLAGIDESQSISNSTGNLLITAGKSGLLDGAMLGCRGDKKKAGADILAALSHFLVLSSSGESSR